MLDAYSMILRNHSRNGGGAFCRLATDDIDPGNVVAARLSADWSTDDATTWQRRKLAGPTYTGKASATGIRPRVFRPLPVPVVYGFRQELRDLVARLDA